MRGRVKVCVMYGDGINCDNETIEAFRLAGAEPKKALIAEIADRSVILEDYQILAFPGGFSAGDYLGAGKFFAIKLKTMIGGDITKFVEDEKTIIGICNGFQVLTKYPLLPSPSPLSEQTISVTYNESARFENRWIYVKVNQDSPCVFTRGIDIMHLPCRHGEGRVSVSDDQVLKALKGENQVVARYAHSNGTPAQERYPANPNGSIEDIAGICDASGRIFGWMPHAEAFLHFTNDPQWTIKKDEMKRKGLVVPRTGDGLRIFENAVEHVRERF